MTGQKKSWNDLTPAQRRMVVVGGAVELVLTSWAASDLRRRPADQVRGPKAAWAMAFAVQPLGPIAYLALGRR
jgi:hypothetical protein